MKDFKEINFEILKSENVKVEYFESDYNASLLLIKIYGKILNGSSGHLDCLFISQKIGLALLNST